MNGPGLVDADSGQVDVKYSSSYTGYATGGFLHSNSCTVFPSTKSCVKPPARTGAKAAGRCTTPSSN